MRRCLWCEEPVEEVMTFARLFYQNASKNRLCGRCFDHLKPVERESGTCRTCDKLSEKEVCTDCLNWKKRYPDYTFKHRSLFYYNAFAGEFMEKYKIVGDCELALLFAEVLKEHFSRYPSHSVFIPVPISETSRAVRGFNQVELLLEAAGLPYIKGLKNIGTGEKQARKNKVDRMKLAQPFVAVPEAESALLGAHAVLVDDLYTTGRTLFHAADALKKLSPQSVESFSLFR